MSQFPTEIDALQALHGSKDPVLAARIRDLGAAIEATQTRIGVEGTSDPNSLEYRIENFTPGPHASTHQNGGGDEINVGGLSGLLADPQTPLAHSHSWSDITSGLPTTLAGYGITDAASDAELAAHEADTTSVHGIANTALLLTTATKLDDLAAPDDNTDLNASTSAHGLMQKYPGGTTKFLRADGSFAAPSASVAWGGITGTLSNQTDLQGALDAKAAASHTHGVGDIASLSAGVLVGRTNASGGSGQEITPTTGLEMSGTNLRNKDQMTVLIATLDQDVTNAQNQDSTYFTFSVTAGKRYLVDVELAISGNDTTGDFEWRFAVAAGTMNGGGTTQSLSTSLAVQNVAITASAAANTANLRCGVSANLEAPQAVRALFAFVPSNTTTFKLQFGNNSAAAGRTSRIMQGSIVRYKQMN